ncbi:MAG: hypothetical protein JRN57_01090 [Nitrososphaerota archaeon]|nr:hypothetical protein [Nitrososphaerota archaeon]MDG7010690.1 hypothetical protein [Nitrososphaerota archaeon]
MRYLHAFAAVAVLLLFATQLASAAAAASPPYAVEGAFASYTAQGGFIAYFSGVVGNITYTVTSIFGNGSMRLHIFENITAGTDLNPFISTMNITDNIVNPVNFPAVSLASLSSGHIAFQNVSATFLHNNTASVPAGTFSTMEFTGTDVNGTTVNFWFDRATGLMVEESAGTSVVELASSNIAIPSGPPSGFNGEVAYELVFVIAFAVGGSAFLSMRYYYTKSAKAKRDAADGKAAANRKNTTGKK